jgi:hypothetical protein
VCVCVCDRIWGWRWGDSTRSTTEITANLGNSGTTFTAFILEKKSSLLLYNDYLLRIHTGTTAWCFFLFFLYSFRFVRARGILTRQSNIFRAIIFLLYFLMTTVHCYVFSDSGPGLGLSDEFF